MAEEPSGKAGGGEGVYPSPVSPPYPAISKEVEVTRAAAAEARSAAYELSSGDVVFEDEWLVVVSKPSGIYCETLLPAVASRCSLRADSILLENARCEAVQLELHLANRLDRDTSGLMVITKSHKVAAKLVKAFTDHKVRKTYIALCIGYVPSWEKIRISSGHGRSKFGAWRVYSASDVGRALPGGSMVKHMVTSLEVLSANGRGEFREPAQLEVAEAEMMIVQGKETDRRAEDEKLNDEILVRAYPQTGRTHQIRLHCQHLGVPIKGDVKYGGVQQWKGLLCDSHFLHAESLSFSHPVTGVPVQLRAPLPLWAREVGSQVLKDS